MLEFDDIQHILLTRAPALTGRYEFLSFRDPAGWAGVDFWSDPMRSTSSAETMRATVREAIHVG